MRQENATPLKHEYVIEYTGSVYVVKCDCGFQSEAYTHEHAEIIGDRHIRTVEKGNLNL